MTWPKVRYSPRRDTGRLVALFKFKTNLTPGLFVYLILDLPSHNTTINQYHFGFPKLNAANRVQGLRNTSFFVLSRWRRCVFRENQSKPLAVYIYSNAVLPKADSYTLKEFLISLRGFFCGEGFFLHCSVFTRSENTFFLPVLNESDNVTDRFVMFIDRGPLQSNAGRFTGRQDRLCGTILAEWT